MYFFKTWQVVLIATILIVCLWKVGINFHPFSIELVKDRRFPGIATGVAIFCISVRVGADKNKTRK